MSYTILSISYDGVFEIAFDTSLSANIRIHDQLIVDGDSSIFLDVQNIKGNILTAVTLSDLNGVSRTSSVTNAQTPILVPVGNGTLGRVMDPLGTPTDSSIGIGGFTNSIYNDPLAYTDITFSTDIIETGIKIIDLMCPIIKGSNNIIFANYEQNRDLILEIIYNLTNDSSTIIDNFVHTSSCLPNKYMKQFHKKLQDNSLFVSSISGPSIVNSPSYFKPGLISKTLFSGITLAEFFRDNNKNVLLLNNDALLNYKSLQDVDYLCNTKQNITYDYEQLLGRIGNKTNYGSITCLNFTNVENKYFSDYQINDMVKKFTGSIKIGSDGELSVLLHNINYNIIQNTQKNLIKNIIQLLEDYESLKNISSSLLTTQQQLTVNRAIKVNNFFTQPYHINGVGGKYVSLSDTINGFTMILNGDVDNIDNNAFYMIGDISEAQ